MLKTLVQTNRARVIKALKAVTSTDGAAILMRGHRPAHEHDACSTHPHMQFEANFSYVFGVQVYHFDGLLFLDSEEAYLINRLEESNLKFTVPSASLLADNYGIGGVVPSSSLLDVLKKRNVTRVFLHSGDDIMTGIHSNEFEHPDLEKIKEIVDRDALYPILNATRAIKSEIELKFMEEVCKASSLAHREVIRACRPGMKEHQLSAIFYSTVAALNKGGDWAYFPICCSGEDCAILHYHKNDKDIENGAMLLLDMGCKYHGVCSDVTTSFPANGKFTQSQKEIFELTAKAQAHGISRLKPGVKYLDIHKECIKIILEGLIEIGLLKGTIEEIEEANFGSIFMPHSLGHFIGYKTHDVGLPMTMEVIEEGESRILKTAEADFEKEPVPEGEDEEGKKTRKEKYLQEKKDALFSQRKDKLKKYLPVTRTTLEPGMVVTVEPGIYFVPILIEKAKKDEKMAKFCNFEKIDQYQKEVGGVRIEDCIVLTDDGHRVLSDIPRTVDEIEKMMASQALEL